MRAAAQPTLLLRLRDGAVTYPNGRRALGGVNFHVRAGEFLVLLGPSGAGKSTLLRSLNGLVPLTEGTLEADGLGPVRLASAFRALRKRTGMVFQQHQLIGRLSALANVLTGRLAYHSAVRTLLPLPREDKLIALRALDRVGLLEVALARVDQLSGGQQQRVGVARALAQEPRLVLADEPVASVDPVTAARVLAFIHDVCRAEGIAAVVSLHQVSLTRRFADRVVALSAGTVVYDGSPDDLDDVALNRIYGTDARDSGDDEAEAGAATADPATLAW